MLDGASTSKLIITDTHGCSVYVSCLHKKTEISFFLVGSRCIRYICYYDVRIHTFTVKNSSKTNSLAHVDAENFAERSSASEVDDCASVMAALTFASLSVWSKQYSHNRYIHRRKMRSTGGNSPSKDTGEIFPIPRLA